MVSQIELTLLIFRRLAEDLLSYDSAISNQRKSIMLASLKEESVLTPLFDLITRVFQVRIMRQDMLSTFL